jgi:hypothetical protein
MKTEEKFMFLIYELFLGLSRGEETFVFGRCYSFCKLWNQAGDFFLTLLMIQWLSPMDTREHETESSG